MPIAHVVGFDDFPFQHSHRGNVGVVGTVYSGLRLEGVLHGKVRRDGIDSTRVLATLVEASRFAAHLQLVMLEGIALAGFNVVDIRALHERLGIAVLVVTRKAPDLEAVQAALEGRVTGGKRKWELIQKAGRMKPVAGLYVQSAGLSEAEIERTLRRFALHGRVPEPLRTAHLIAAGVGGGRQSQS